MRPLTVSAGQADCVPLDIPANTATAAALLRSAAEQGADLLVLPELFLTGYELAGITADPAGRTLAQDDPRLDELAAACAETRTAVVVGAPTRDPGSGALHISALVLGRDGGFAAQYDKQHCTPGERAAGFTPAAPAAPWCWTAGGWASASAGTSASPSTPARPPSTAATPTSSARCSASAAAPGNVPWSSPPAPTTTPTTWCWPTTAAPPGRTTAAAAAPSGAPTAQ
ncbi:carbon-nitrogen hydrolase family protein [Streptacidiphilus sp. 4-A2]|nr:carbon-nitrogen hydrolase family protein [Streptacidiphilus sp. 4-A2]